MRTGQQRRRFAPVTKGALAAACLALSAVVASPAWADAPLPADAAARLLVKVARYDKNFSHRAGEGVHVLLLVKPDDRASVTAVAEMQAALTAFSEIAGLPHDETIYAYDGATELAATCRAKRVSIVFVAPGFGGDVGDIRDALDGIDVLSVAASPDDVPRGLVLGFDSVGGKPKVLVHLGQARRQNVAFRADLLKLAKVYN